MMTIAKEKKTDSFLSYLLVFIIIFISTKSSTLSSSIFLSRFVTFILLGIFIYKNFKIERKFLKFTLYFFVYSLIICIKYGDRNPFFDFLFYFIDVILLVYLTLKIVGTDFFVIYEKIVYKWSLYIFPLYLFQLIMPDTIFKLNNALGSVFNVLSANVERENYSNSIFFTMINGVHKDRNCGFMWEPGAFGALLIIALVIYLYNNRFKFNTKVVIYLVIILSTYSTTAYLNLLLLPFFYLFNTKTKNNIFIGSMLIIFALIFLNFSSSTVLGKINFQFDNLDNDLIRLDYNLEETIVLDRFASLVYLFPTIQDNYVIGTGWSFVNEISIEKAVGLSNGVAFYLVMFGLLGFIFFINNIHKTGYLFFNRNKKQAVLFVIVVVIIGFSNPVLLLPLFVSLQLYGSVDLKKTFTTGNKLKYDVIK